MITWLKFFICAMIIFFAGKRVAKYGDIIAEKTGLGGLWIGLVLLAISTSLPEIFTGVGSVVFVDAPDLTFGNILGANTYNLLNLTLLDFLHKGEPLLSAVSPGQTLTAGLSLLPLAIASVGLLLSQKFMGLSFANISVFSFLILVFYLISVRKIYNFEKTQQQFLAKLQVEKEKVLKYEGSNLKSVFINYCLWALIIVGAGIYLSYIGDELAGVLKVGQSFVGALLLGFSTTLPEITVSIAALRLGAKEMAVANMIGSNLFNIAIIFLNDLLYRKDDIFLKVSHHHIFSTWLIAIMTVIVIQALISKPRKKAFLNISWYSLGLILVFVVGAYINFVLARR